MATAIIKPISNEEVAKAQIEGNLPDKPSQATLYGGKVLTPQEIKAWYDKLPKLIVEYYNNLIKAIPGIEEGKISDNSLAAKILTNIMENHSLKDLLEDITSGAFADYLTVTGDVKLTGFFEKVLARINTFGPEAPSGEAELGNIYAEVKEYGIKALYMYVGKWVKLWNGEYVPPVTEKDEGKVLATDGTSTAWKFLGIDGLFEAKDFTSQFTPNSAVNLDTVGAVAGEPYISAKFKTLEVECRPGDIFEINGSSGEREARKVGFVDANRVIRWRLSNNNIDHQDKPLRLTAPEGAAKLICNFSMMTEYPNEYVVKLGKYMAKLYDAEKAQNGLCAAKDLSDQFENGKAVNLGEVGGVAGAPYTSTEYKMLEVDCKEGEVVEVNGSNGSGNARLFGFVDANRVTLWRLSNNNIDHQNKPIRMTAPEGTAKLICNFAMVDDYPNEYVIKMGKYTAYPPNAVINDTTEYRYLAPKWAEIFDFSEKAYTNRLNFVGFDEQYQAFHGLNEDGFIEEINLSDDYLANNTDTIPEAFGSITNADMYMWHVLPPKDDGNGVYTPKYKRAKLMILGGLHGGEKRSVWNLYYMLKDMHDRVTSRAINILRSFFDIYIVPLCNPSGLENLTRENANGVNLNRDFWNLHWTKTPDSGDTYNSQYETRCLSWWIKQIKPDIFVDHHTSTGDNSIENGRFLAWGDSYIRSINSLIEETLIELSPIVRNKYYQYLGEYEFVYGHTQDAESYVDYGMAPHFAYYNGAISCTFEVVQGVKWDGVRVFDASSDVDQTALMTIEYFNWINYLLRFVTEAVAMLNGKSRI